MIFTFAFQEFTKIQKKKQNKTKSLQNKSPAG